MKKFALSLFFLLCVLPFSAIYGQNDYIITTEDETISGITITSFPLKLVQFTVNVYNDNLMARYEDLKITYTSPKHKKPVTIEYNEVKKFGSSGTDYTTWHARKIPYIDGKIIFDTIVEAPGKTKDELYAMARSALIMGMSLTADQIQKTLIEDKESGSIMVKRLIVGSGDQGRFSSYIFFDLLVRVKDGKARMSIADIKLHYAKGAIFNDASLFSYEVKAEIFAEKWRSGNNIKSHYYKGVLLMFYNIEDVLITNFVNMFTGKQKSNDW
ncbi:MAG: hypothetical protein CVT93_02945 [Bacteroidetes bacterium HGW-Bacteroidetes-10]|nr:MAG: hypothetical protein CVT93_02945 [Bacteroidetes bacterium HGW-Bacteroidetes-10]